MHTVKYSCSEQVNKFTVTVKKVILFPDFFKLIIK